MTRTLVDERKPVTDVAVYNSGVPVQVEREMTPEQVELIKNTVAKGASNDELRLFLYIAKKTGLDPLTRQIYFVKIWDSTLQKMVGTSITGIDGYRVVAERSGKYAGQDAPIFEYDGNNKLRSATVTVYKLIAGERIGFTATAFFSEYVQTKKDGAPNSMWAKMPHSQLAKCAEALALRKAFPNDLSGVYTMEEMEQAIPADDPNAVDISKAPSRTAALTAQLKKNSNLLPSGETKPADENGGGDTSLAVPPEAPPASENNSEPADLMDADQRHTLEVLLGNRAWKLSDKQHAALRKRINDAIGSSQTTHDEANSLIKLALGIPARQTEG